MINQQRKAIKEGSWYNNRSELYDELKNYYTKLQHQLPEEKTKFVISPHAGLYYCEEIQDLNNYDSIIILGVCHCFTLKGLGQSPFKTWDGIFVSDLQNIETSFKKVNPQNCQKEHSIEILIPYISLLMKEQNKKLPIIPIYCGSKATQKEIQQLKEIQQQNNSLVVISSDFCHYGYNFDYMPVIEGKTRDQTIDYLNDIAVKGIIQGPNQFFNVTTQYEITICGLFSIYCGLSLFCDDFNDQNANKESSSIKQKINYNALFVGYKKSGRITKITDSSVSYCGIVGLDVKK